MPPIEITGLYDYAVLWAAGTPDGYGRTKLGAPQEVRVRWVGGQQEAQDPQSTSESWPTEVTIGQDVTPGSIMWYGKLVDLPTVPTDLYRVVGIQSTKDIKGRRTHRALTLVRLSDTRPDLDT